MVTLRDHVVEVLVSAAVLADPPFTHRDDFHAAVRVLRAVRPHLEACPPGSEGDAVSVAVDSFLATLDAPGGPEARASTAVTDLKRALRPLWLRRLGAGRVEIEKLGLATGREGGNE